jgi:hypothetical protein
VNADRDSKVIGYFALASSNDIVCSGEACVIAGSEASMRGFIEEFDPGVARVCTIRKTRFGEIVAGLKHGAPYAFDEVSFARFFPLAVEIGLPVAVPDFAAARARGDRFLTLQLFRAQP